MWTLLKPIALDEKLPYNGKDKAYKLGRQMPRTSRWLTRRGRLDEKPSNDGTKTPRPHTLSASKTHTVIDCQPRLIRWWTRKGDKAKREELSCILHVKISRLSSSFSINHCHSPIVFVSWMCCKKKKKKSNWQSNKALRRANIKKKSVCCVSHSCLTVTIVRFVFHVPPTKWMQFVWDLQTQHLPLRN